ncbi:MAG: magnesium-dependent phosphatase-1 [Verrucomicrobiota bacterium]
MPQLIVFDLDLTLWHCGPLLWCDQLTEPLTKTPSGQIHDANNTPVRLYDDVPALLDQLTAAGQLLALASRTSSPHLARQLLDLFHIAHHFPPHLQQIFPDDKQTHFRNLHQETGIPYSDMLFFDDEPRNIHSVSQLGVTAIHVPTGLDLNNLSQISQINRVL